MSINSKTETESRTVTCTTKEGIAGVGLFQWAVRSGDGATTVKTDHYQCRYGNLWNSPPACPWFGCADPDACTSCKTDWLAFESEDADKVTGEEAAQLERIRVAEEKRQEALHASRVASAKPATGFWLGQDQSEAITTDITVGPIADIMSSSASERELYEMFEYELSAGLSFRHDRLDSALQVNEYHVRRNKEEAIR